MSCVEIAAPAVMRIMARGISSRARTLSLAAQRPHRKAVGVSPRIRFSKSRQPRSGDISVRGRDAHSARTEGGMSPLAGLCTGRAIVDRGLTPTALRLSRCAAKRGLQLMARIREKKVAGRKTPQVVSGKQLASTIGGLALCGLCALGSGKVLLLPCRAAA